MVIYKIGTFKIPRSYQFAPIAIRKMFLILSTTNYNAETILSKLIIHNLSNIQIPSLILHIFNLGGKFIPNIKSNIKRSEILTSSTQLQRDIKIKHFFLDSSSSINDFNYKFHIKSKWTPDTDPQLTPLLSKVNQLFLKETNQNPQRIPLNINMTTFHDARNFLIDNNLLVKASDKNMGLTIIPISWYNNQIRIHLQDTNTYTPLGSIEYYNNHIKQPLHTKFKHMLNNLFNKYPFSFTKQEKKFLIKDSEKKLNNLPQFHLLPKLHKTPQTTRPIIPNINTISTNLSIYISDKLQPLNNHFPWILKDTNTLINYLKELKFDQPYSIITGDVTSLYTNIPIELGIQHLHSLIIKYKREVSKLTFECSAKIITTLTRFIMNNNIFKYQLQTIQQIKGVAMGTNMAPEFASLFLIYYELDIIDTLHAAGIYYYRYIDDIIIIHPTTTNPIITLQEIFNPPLEITWEDSSTSINFLDLSIYITKNHVEYELYVKPLNAFQYVPYNSGHPFGVKKGIIFGNIKRILTHCSTRRLQLKHIEKQYKILQNRGYPSKFLLPLFIKAYNKFITTNNNNNNNNNYNTTSSTISTTIRTSPSFIIRGSYHPFWYSTATRLMLKQVKTTIRSNYNLLSINPIDNITLSLRRSNNIFDSLNRSNNLIIKRSEIDLPGNKRRKTNNNQGYSIRTTDPLREPSLPSYQH